MDRSLGVLVFIVGCLVFIVVVNVLGAIDDKKYRDAGIPNPRVVRKNPPKDDGMGPGHNGIGGGQSGGSWGA